MSLHRWLLVGVIAVLTGTAAWGFGFRGGGGGGYRPAPRPNFAPQPRPAMPAPRPAPAPRPNFSSMQRPGMGAPSFGGIANRPNIGGFDRNLSRNIRNPALDRPGFVPRPPSPERPGGFGGGQRWPDSRPDFRPNINVGNRPNINIGNRGTVNVGNRPDFRPGINIGNRGNVNIGNRGTVNIGNRPDFRPGINVGNRVAIGNRNTAIGLNRTNVFAPTINRTTNFNQANFARAGWGGRYGIYHPGWYGRSWAAWPSAPAIWLGAGALTAGAAYAYSNPFYDQPYVDPSAAIPVPTVSYAQPIPVPAAAPAVQDVPIPVTADTPVEPDPFPEDQAPPAPTDPALKEALDKLNDAQVLFKGGKYDQALYAISRAIELQPGDVALHEFRALVLFAMSKYHDAAAGVYAVLSNGPPWDWATMKGFYPDETTYTTQLRALESYVKEHPDKADAAFLLAYHYLVLGFRDEAAGLLQDVLQLQPKDQLSQQLLDALKTNAAAATAPAASTGG